eukprot:136872-Rhodomonas_salina.2
MLCTRQPVSVGTSLCAGLCTHQCDARAPRSTPGLAASSMACGLLSRSCLSAGPQGLSLSPSLYHWQSSCPTAAGARALL